MMHSVRPILTIALAAGLAAAPLPSVRPAMAQEGQVVVVVNGLPITSFDIPQRQRLLQIREGRPHSREQALDDLINDRVKFSEARRFRVDANEAQVLAAYAQVAGGRLRFDGIVLSQDGREAYEAHGSGSADDAAAIGRAAGEDIMRRAPKSFRASVGIG